MTKNKTEQQQQKQPPSVLPEQSTPSCYYIPHIAS